MLLYNKNLSMILLLLRKNWVLSNSLKYVVLVVWKSLTKKSKDFSNFFFYRCYWKNRRYIFSCHCFLVSLNFFFLKKGCLQIFSHWKVWKHCRLQKIICEMQTRPVWLNCELLSAITREYWVIFWTNFPVC